jgi:2-(1,2-epoxy-1,2-dihydrophenyl)acetyl-CoA isomerase
MAYEHIKQNLNDRVLTITFDRPEVLNAMTPDGYLEMADAVNKGGENPDVGAIIITGEGRGFQAGANLKTQNEERVQLRDLKAKQEHNLFGDQWALRDLRNSVKPTIAAINGLAYGGGMTVALLCDLKIASTEAQFGTAYLKIGLVPGAGLFQSLIEHVGKAKAIELIYTARDVGAAEALEIGLVNEMVPPAELMSRAQELASQLAHGPTRVLGMAKAQMLRLFDYAAEIERESYEQVIVGDMEDRTEGVKAFQEKRAPSFGGE